MTSVRITNKYRYIIYFSALSLLTILYFHVGQTVAINSDGVANILEAKSIINGNIILHGWNLPSDTFYTIDTQLDIIFTLLGISATTIYHLTPAVIYSSLNILVFLIVKNISKNNYISLISSAIFLAFPVSTYKSLVLFSPIHVMTILFIVLAFYMYHLGGVKFKYTYSFLLLYFAVVGDPYALFIGVAPIVCYSLLMIFRESDINSLTSPYMKMIASSVVAAVLAKVTVHIIGAEGGYHVVKNQMRFVSLDRFSHNIYLFFESILVVTQSNFFGRQLFSYETIIDLIQASLIVLTAILLVVYIKRQEYKDIPVIVKLSRIAILVSCFAFVFSTEPINIDTSRYLLDIPVFVAILFGYLLSTFKSRRIYIFSVLSAVAIFVGFLYRSIEATPASEEGYIKVINFLERHNLHYGFAGYWNAAPFTILSNYNVKVRQVIADARSSILPFAWLSNSQWYKDFKHPQFIIIGKSGNFGLNESVLDKNYGAPKQTKIIGEYKVFVYR